MRQVPSEYFADNGSGGRMQTGLRSLISRLGRLNLIEIVDRAAKR